LQENVDIKVIKKLNDLPSGLTGILTLDDGANWNVALTFEDGVLTTQVIGVSTGASATWT
ncbi:unnamed protein product, partial [marine sediment metagenome]